MKHHYIATRMAKIKMLSVGKNKRYLEYSYTPGECVNICTITLGKRVVIPTKARHMCRP